MIIKYRSLSFPGPIPVLCLLIGLLCSFGSLAAQKNILIVGDSISAAYGMSLEEGWVALLARRLEQDHSSYAVVNASISGETSAGAAARLPELLREHQPAIVVLELGGNDGLRGYPIKRFRANMQQMLDQSRASGAAVLLLGMEIPPNYGARYTDLFRNSYTSLAEASDAPLVPFLLEGVATDSTLMQRDGIHPNPKAQQQLLDNVWGQLHGLLVN